VRGHVDQEPVAGGEAQLRGPGLRAGQQRRVPLAGAGVRGEVVTVPAYRRDEVGEAGRHLPHRQCERVQGQRVAFPGRPAAGLVDPVGGGEEHVHVARGVDHGQLGRPAAEQHGGGLPVRREQHRGRVAGGEGDLVDEQVGRLGHPVRQRRAGQFGALAGGIVVPGQQRSGGVGRDRVGEHPGNVVGHRRERYAPGTRIR
jgi:hypothetical protein